MSPVQGLDERACRFAKDAEFARSAAMRELERSVCGCDYGSTSWTTRVEAERIAPLLTVQTIEMAKKLVEARIELQRAGTSLDPGHFGILPALAR